jgi:methanogenic corrinoid protein MtbC1
MAADRTQWITPSVEGTGDTAGSLDLVGVGSDLTLIIDEGGVIRHVTVGQPGLKRELSIAAQWRGLAWAETVAPQTRPTIDVLLRTADGSPPSPWRHVDQLAAGGSLIPLLYSTVRVGNNIIACGRDLRLMDLTSLVLDHEASVARSYARAMRMRGIGLETLWLDVLAPAARRLGELWLNDVCSFVDVTAGVGCLQDLLHASAHSGQMPVRDVVQSKRILLAAAPNERHSFGLAMVAAFFRQAGWFVRLEGALSDVDLAQEVKRNWFAVIGISESDETRLNELAALIRTLRRVSRNAAVRIMVGGPLFTHKPELARQVGADATAFDGRQAVQQAQRFLDGPGKGLADADAVARSAPAKV